MILCLACARIVCNFVFSDFLSMAGMLSQDTVVDDNTMCITFGACRSGQLFRSMSPRSGYATFSAISATGAREMKVSVMFGALLFGPLVASCRRSSSDHAADIAQES